MHILGKAWGEYIKFLINQFPKDNLIIEKCRQIRQKNMASALQGENLGLIDGKTNHYSIIKNV